MSSSKIVISWDWKKALYMFFKYYLIFVLTVLIWKVLFYPKITQSSPPSPTSASPDSKASISEAFENNAETSSITFVPKNEGALFLLEDSDKYVQSMSKSDLYARKVTCQEAYRLQGYYSTIDPSESQKTLLQNACKKADEFFKSYIPISSSSNEGGAPQRKGFNELQNLRTIAYFDAEKAMQLPWNFIMVKDDYEQGLPHTRSIYIILHPKLLQESMDDIVETLIHEKIHVYQRKYRKETSFVKSENTTVYLTEYMVSKMGFERIKKRSEVACDIRANPDLDEWIYRSPKTKREMYLCYRSGQPSGIDDVIGESIDEHPYEYIAYEISKRYREEKQK